ncbi:hypothetical protein [Brucella intermedia]|uniref:hypothetical protein n=1 Tax=Brucella intermedia TaxID=94625 RepID=UPI0022492B72|nr:hypothetical protein [Brucella intermedia]
MEQVRPVEWKKVYTARRFLPALGATVIAIIVAPFTLILHKLNTFSALFWGGCRCMAEHHIPAMCGAGLPASTRDPGLKRNPHLRSLPEDG